VIAVEVDAKKDLCHVTYDPEQVGPEQLLEAVRGTGFEGQMQPSEAKP
jgi:copper chaperone CopZ